MFDQLSCRRNPNSTQHSFGLTDINLFRRKIDVRAEIGELHVIGFSSLRPEWKCDLRITYIQSVEKRLTMNQSGVIDIQRDLANTGKRVLAIFIVEYSYISCD